MPARTPRMYEPIWEKLKAERKVTLAVPEKLQPRVIKAIQKEKYNDIAYKIELSEEDKEAELSFESHQSRVIVILTITKLLTLRDIL